MEVIHGDCIEVLKTFKDRSVDLVVTSFPYKCEDGYSDKLMFNLGVQLGRVVTTMVFLNGGQLREQFMRPFRAQAAFARGAAGWLKPWQTISWVKSIVIHREQMGHYQPINSPNILNYCWEPVFTFVADTNRSLDRLSIGTEYADKSNLTRGTRGKHGDLHCAGDAWFIPYPTTGASSKKATSDLKHAYSFPEELVERCIKLAALPAGATVLDPFVGSGTTLRVAEKLGFNAIGIDIDAEAVCLAKK